jgi:hypothetical protein
MSTTPETGIRVEDTPTAVVNVNPDLDGVRVVVSPSIWK